LIVGGGIRSGEQVKEKVKAGADVIVTGNVVEEFEAKDKVEELVKHVKWYRRALKRPKRR
jgi:phosphoglycerol geranylgeranyltransferase